MEKNLKKILYMHVSVCVKLNHFAVHLKLIHHCKLTILQFFKWLLAGGKKIGHIILALIQDLDLQRPRLEETGLLWWSSDWSSKLPMQGAWVPSMVSELDPTCHN